MNDPTRDLRLFGAGDVAGDLTFEVKAAMNIQQHTTPSDGADFDPSVDSEGRRLVFASTRHSSFSHLYVKSLEGTTLTQLTDERANDAQPAFSPDGGRIAFTSDRAGQWDIWIVDVNGRNATQVTTTPMAELHPTWSPDGTRLAYCRLNSKQGRGELWVVELDRPGVKRLIGEGLFPSWSPTEDRIAYQRARARGSRWFSLWTTQLVNDEAQLPVEVATSPVAALIAPSWSADGSQIAFTYVVPEASRDRQTDPEEALRRSTTADIGIVDADGRGMQRLTNGQGENYSPHWGSDDRIYFTARHSKSETIWSVKPFRPVLREPIQTPPNRRAARVEEPAVED
jgi:TolB protein